MNEFELDRRLYKVLNSGKPLSENDLAHVEVQIGMHLPSQLRSYYLRWNGGLPYPLDVPDYAGVWVSLRWKEGVEAARVGPAAPVSRLLIINGDPDRDFIRTWTDFRSRIPSDCLCFARDPGGNLYLIGMQPHNLGRIYFWERAYEANIDAGESPSYDNVADVANSLKDFLLALREEPKADESLDAWVRRVYCE